MVKLKCAQCGNEDKFVSSVTCQANVVTTYQQTPEGRLIKQGEQTEVIQPFETFYKCGKCKRTLPNVPDWEERVAL